MTVNHYDPKQTTTLATPKKVIEEQAQSASITGPISASVAKIGFVSLEAPKAQANKTCNEFYDFYLNIRKKIVSNTMLSLY